MSRVIIFGLSNLLFVVGATIWAQTPNSPRPNGDGCGAAQPQNVTAKGKPFTVTGILTKEGVECPALRADDGTLYTLTGKFKKFKVGDRVQVAGEIAEFSFCQQGITINVRRIKRA
ncbi:MAG: DUF5818 domain-containing protein [Planctomycetaceae bacterium]